MTPLASSGRMKCASSQAAFELRLRAGASAASPGQDLNLYLPEAILSRVLEPADTQDHSWNYRKAAGLAQSLYQHCANAR